MGKNQHVVKNEDQWSVKGEGNDRATKNHDTQKEAIEHAKTIAKNQKGDVIIHKEDGEIRARKSYETIKENTSSSSSSTAQSDTKSSSTTASTSQTTTSGGKSLWGRIKSIFSSSN